MSTDTPPLDPTETDQSDLIIDPETLTQWVDGTIPSPHKMSVDNLAAKFPVLIEYKKDAEQLRSLFREAFSPEIVAPANTVCRVMTALKNELGVEEAPQETVCREKTAHLTAEPEQTSREKTHALLPTPEKEEEDEPAFVIHFPEKNKKIPRYLLPAAALLFLMALVGSIIHSEHSSSSADTLAQKERHTKNLFPFSLKRHRSMDAGPRDPHSASQESRAHLTNYDTTGGKTILTQEQEKKKKEEEDKKALEKKKNAASKTGIDQKSSPSR